MIRCCVYCIKQKSQKRAAPFVGMDDFAWKKGHRYGLLICDARTHQPIEMLPDREKETIQKWLQAHPEITRITRDRYSRFKEAMEEIRPDL
ncbi:transposase [Alkalicoccus urumqiensis]|nr:transposase [Alkalicoccus urumqiensis]